jgi:hypothetical protein
MPRTLILERPEYKSGNLIGVAGVVHVVRRNPGSHRGL